MRLLARNLEPKSVVYDPIPYASEQGSYCWPSRELNRGHQGINSPDQRTPRFGCDFNPPKPSIRTARPRRAGCPEEAELHLSRGDPLARLAFCAAAQLPRSPAAAPRRSGRSRRASCPAARLTGDDFRNAHGRAGPISRPAEGDDQESAASASHRSRSSKSCYSIPTSCRPLSVKDGNQAAARRRNAGVLPIRAGPVQPQPSSQLMPRSG